MKISSAVRTHTGNIREKNEDNFLLESYIRELSIQNTEVGLVPVSIDEIPSLFFAVCDGMGGEHYGDIASLIAVRTLDEFSRSLKKLNFEDCIQEANSRVCEEMTRRKVHRMGTTVAALYLNENKATICNLGDSRIYLFSDQHLQQISEDHREIAPSGKGTALTQHLGVRPDEFTLEPFVKGGIELFPGMLFLLCSDGLTDMVADDELNQLISVNYNNSAQQIADQLVEYALQNGGRDNVTALIVKVEKERIIAEKR